MSWTWLVSCGGRRGALVRLLADSPVGGRSRVVVTDASPLSSAGQLADEFELVPRIDSGLFLTETMIVADRYDVSAIVPTIDPELPLFAAHREEFRAAGHDVLVSAPPVILLSSDKWELSRWLDARGLPTVATHEAVGFDPGTLAGPVVAKPRDGSSSIGVITARSAEELPLRSLSDNYIIQERAYGIEITVDFAISRGGRLLGAVPRRRLEVRAGEVSKAVTVRVPEVESLVRELAGALEGAYGILNVQLFFDPGAREVRIIELNARVGGGFPLSHAAGADFFGMLAVGTETELPDWREDLVMLRFDDAAFLETPDYRIRS